MGLLSILRVADRGPVARRQRRTFTPSLGLSVESLESRVVLSRATVAVAAPAANNIDVGAILGDAINFRNIDITGVQLGNLSLVNGVLTATSGTVTGLVGSLPFTTDITNFALQLVPNNPATPGTECAILSLELAPIDIDLLGLHVDTSDICLNVTAVQGQLLGDLLCGLAGSGLNVDLGALNGLLGRVLGDAFGAAQQPGQGGGGGGGQAEPEDICDGECEILDLALGPVDLNLLGLRVQLDNCDGGPVQVCVSATAGEGLLGNLLCRLSDTPNFDFDLADVTRLARTAANLLSDGVLSGRDVGQLTSLFNQLRR